MCGSFSLVSVVTALYGMYTSETSYRQKRKRKKNPQQQMRLEPTRMMATFLYVELNTLTCDFLLLLELKFKNKMNKNAVAMCSFVS